MPSGRPRAGCGCRSASWTPASASTARTVSRRLFDAVHPGDSSTTRVYGGTGLGLAISREIVVALGGDIVYAPRPGGGSVFSFTAVLDPVEPARRLTSLESVPPDPDDPATELATRRAPRARVLVVEDNDINQMVAVGVLESLGYTATTAGDGVEAVAASADPDVDVILMDVQMPRMDGYAATRTIREREPGGRRVPIIAMTAAAVTGERERCLEAGMDFFLTKPIEPGSLAAVLDEALHPGGGGGGAALPTDGGREGLESGQL